MKAKLMSAVVVLAFSSIALAEDNGAVAAVYEVNGQVMSAVNNGADAVAGLAGEIDNAVLQGLAVTCTLEANTFSAGPISLPVDSDGTKLGGNGSITCTQGGASTSHEVSVAGWGTGFGIGPRHMKMRMVGVGLQLDEALDQALTVAWNWKAGLSVLGLGGSIGGGFYVTTAPGVGFHITTTTSQWFEAALGLEHLVVTDLISGVNYGGEYDYDHNCKAVFGGNKVGCMPVRK